MALREAWLSAPEGRLCPWQQARALALREASQEIHGTPWLRWIAQRLEKVFAYRTMEVAGHCDDVALNRRGAVAQQQGKHQCHGSLREFDTPHNE